MSPTVRTGKQGIHVFECSLNRQSFAAITLLLFGFEVKILRWKKGFCLGLGRWWKGWLPSAHLRRHADHLQDFLWYIAMESQFDCARTIRLESEVVIDLKTAGKEQHSGQEQAT